MKKVLFIHGAYHAGWCWEEIKEQLLKTAKFELHTPDLPGHGQNQVPRQNVGLDTYVDYVSQYIQENNLEDFTVVAHSFGGIVASRIAEMHPEKISGIFFVSASILDNDRCFFDFMPMAVQEMYKKMAEESEDYSIEPNKESLKVKIFNESINSPKLQNFIDKLGR
ncbi:MAG: hypothetical protein QG609_571, partial [Patescibacteria group bacterium]|nr:hypothetical protein [Patescibacteria group bacterium]